MKLQFEIIKNKTMITFYERNTDIFLAKFRMVRVMSSVVSKHNMSKTCYFLFHAENYHKQAEGR